MILKKHYKVLLACLLSILVLLALKTGGNVYKRVSSMHSVSFNGENGNVREGKTRLPCCKWDESVLGKKLIAAFLVLAVLLCWELVNELSLHKSILCGLCGLIER